MSTDEGDIVLDPFAGTGTTALAAKRLGRNFIGFELDEQYQQIAESKLAQEKADSKIGQVWVSFFLEKVATMRNVDWEELAPHYIIPTAIQQVDQTAIVARNGHKEVRQVENSVNLPQERLFALP